MIIASQIEPNRRYIATNFLYNKLDEFTYGIITSIDNIPNHQEVACTILVIGSQDGALHKPATVQYRFPSVFCNDLIKLDVYRNCVAHIIVDTEHVDYLQMSEYSFLASMYAKITGINKIANNYLSKNILCKTNKTVGEFMSAWSKAERIATNKALIAMVSTEEKRSKLLFNILRIEKFIAKLPRNGISYKDVLKYFRTLSLEYELKDTMKEVDKILDSGNPEKTLLGLQESKDVLHKYKNSGYWV
jgi:hypothetical protein